jgi:choline dehydrogenase-like flavoprotein
MTTTYDFIIIGTGAGGGTLLYALHDSGAKILVLERGDFLPKEDENWQVKAVFDQKRYKPKEHWINADDGSDFLPGVHYFVGGNTKVYGAALPRFRREDFGALEHESGTSPAWPISYEDLEPYYNIAETIYGVHGTPGADPTEPPRSQSYPYPAVPDEPHIAELRQFAAKPVTVSRARWMPRATQMCAACDLRPKRTPISLCGQRLMCAACSRIRPGETSTRWKWKKMGR